MKFKKGNSGFIKFVLLSCGITVALFAIVNRFAYAASSSDAFPFLTKLFHSSPFNSDDNEEDSYTDDDGTPEEVVVEDDLAGEHENSDFNEVNSAKEAEEEETEEEAERVAQEEVERIAQEEEEEREAEEEEAERKAHEEEEAEE